MTRLKAEQCEIRIHVKPLYPQMSGLKREMDNFLCTAGRLHTNSIHVQIQHVSFNDEMKVFICDSLYSHCKTQSDGFNDGVAVAAAYNNNNNNNVLHMFTASCIMHCE